MEIGAQLDHLLSPKEVSSTGIELYLIELWAKEIPEQSRLLPRGCSLQTDSKVTVMKTTPIQFTEHEKQSSWYLPRAFTTTI